MVLIYFFLFFFAGFAVAAFFATLFSVFLYEHALALPGYFSGMAEIKARRALLTCSAVVNTFATSGSITATRGPSFMRLAKRFGLAFL